MKDILSSVEMFREFRPEELEAIGGFFGLLNFDRDEVIVSKNEFRKELFIVVSGRVVRTVKMRSGADRGSAEFLAGDFFGEMFLFGKKPSLDIYYAAEKTRLLVIKENDILDMINRGSDVAIRFIAMLMGLTIQRLRSSSRFLADVVQWGENASRRVVTDELTGVYSRAFLDEMLEDFFNISKSNNKPLSLLMMDIDNLGRVNEHAGQDAANMVIVKIINLIKSIISRHGIIARYGGDEFSILLPEARRDKAVEIAEQIRSGVEGLQLSRHLPVPGIQITASIGISSYPETTTELEEFKEKGDAALYMAKQAGRNRVAYK